MVADLRKMQENQWVSEKRIDKFRFADMLAVHVQLEIMCRRS